MKDVAKIMTYATIGTILMLGICTTLIKKGDDK